MGTIADIYERNCSRIDRGGQIAGIDLIPDDLLANVFLYIFRKDKLRCRAVCARWCTLLDANRSRDYWGFYNGKCLFGHVTYNIESMKWMVNHLETNRLEAGFSDWFAFYYLCQKGRLDDAKWFAEQFAMTPADAQCKNNQAYFWSHYKKRVEVVRWLADEFGCSHVSVPSAMLTVASDASKRGGWFTRI